MMTMRTARETAIRRALLQALRAVPAGYLLPDDILRADAGRMVAPAATTAELDGEIRDADKARLIVGIPGEDDIRWQVTDAGRAWLAMHQ
jgi:hypothetical protein